MQPLDCRISKNTISTQQFDWHPVYLSLRPEDCGNCSAVWCSECLLGCQQSCWVVDDYAALRCWWLHWAGLELPPCCVPDVSFFLSLFHPLFFFWSWAKLPQGTVGNYDWQPDAGRGRSCFKTSMGFHLVADTSSHTLLLFFSLYVLKHTYMHNQHILLR